MALSLNEIKLRAIQFSKDWSTASRERAEAQTFWNEFFNVFGRSRKLVATFEEPVKNLKGDAEFIDLFWPGTLIAEHKSRGKSLDKANSQAIGYIHNLANTDRARRNAPLYPRLRFRPHRPPRPPGNCKLHRVPSRGFPQTHTPLRVHRRLSNPKARPRRSREHPCCRKTRQPP